jgi:hypothetical protein
MQYPGRQEVMEVYMKTADRKKGCTGRKVADYRLFPNVMFMELGKVWFTL